MLFRQACLTSHTHNVLLRVRNQNGVKVNRLTCEWPTYDIRHCHGLWHTCEQINFKCYRYVARYADLEVRQKPCTIWVLPCAEKNILLSLLYIAHPSQPLSIDILVNACWVLTCGNYFILDLSYSSNFKQKADENYFLALSVSFFFHKWIAAQ